MFPHNPQRNLVVFQFPTRKLVLKRAVCADVTR
jgi:hypothetical protein